MEVIIFLAIVGLIVAVSGSNKKDDVTTVDIYKPSTRVEESEVIEEKADSSNVVINIQNNVYIHNDYSNKSQGHTEKVWREKGYEVNYGEVYSYMYFGNKIFKNNQVSRVSRKISRRNNISHQIQNPRKSYEEHTYDG